MSLVKYRTNNRTNGFVNPFFDDLFLKSMMDMPVQKRSSVPANISEDEKAFYLDLQIPGWKKEEVSIELNENLMSISANKEESKEENAARFTRKEFSSKSFKRSFTLPEDIDQENIKASFEDGILSIHLPKLAKKEASAARRINIG